MKKTVLTVLGTRPEIIKLSSLIPLLDQKFNQVIIHTGQHYSYSLDKLFFAELNLRLPDFFLNVGSGLHGEQTGKMMAGIERFLPKIEPNFILVQGDTNSTLAGALVAAKQKIPLAHIESGYRSFNLDMPEEVNRIIADRFSSCLFVGDEIGMNNLAKEGIDSNKCYNVGNTAVDALIRGANLTNQNILNKFLLSPSKYILLTCHRADNTDNSQNLKSIIEALNHVSKKIPIIFPLHPRTKKALEREKLFFGENVKIVEPLGYLDFIALLKNARFVMSDSGGVQEEAAELNVPSVVLRNETEAKELLKAGKIILGTNNRDEIIRIAFKLLDDIELDKVKSLPFTSKKGVSQLIVDILLRNFEEE